jgi:hypothetical protein
MPEKARYDLLVGQGGQIDASAPRLSELFEPL